MANKDTEQTHPSSVDESLLQAYLDDELSAEARTEVAHALEQDEDARAMLSELQTLQHWTSQRLSHLHPPEVNLPDLAALLEQMEQESATDEADPQESAIGEPDPHEPAIGEPTSAATQSTTASDESVLWWRTRLLWAGGLVATAALVLVLALPGKQQHTAQRQKPPAGIELTLSRIVTSPPVRPSNNPGGQSNAFVGQTKHGPTRLLTYNLPMPLHVIVVRHTSGRWQPHSSDGRSLRLQAGHGTLSLPARPRAALYFVYARRSFSWQQLRTTLRTIQPAPDTTSLPFPAHSPYRGRRLHTQP